MCLIYFFSLLHNISKKIFRNACFNKVELNFLQITFLFFRSITSLGFSPKIKFLGGPQQYMLRTNTIR